MKKLILSAAFLGLGVFGFAQQSKSISGDHIQKKAEHLQKMKQELNLTDAQVLQLKALHEKKAVERKADFAAKKEDRMQKMKQNEAEMQKILTPEQFKKFQQMKARKMAQKKVDFKERKRVDAAVVK